MVEEGDRIAGVLQVEQTHRPPGRIGRLRCALLVHEADEAAIAEPWTPFGAVRVAAVGERAPQVAAKRRTAPKRAVDGIAEQFVQLPGTRNAARRGSGHADTGAVGVRPAVRSSSHRSRRIARGPRRGRSRPPPAAPAGCSDRSTATPRWRYRRGAGIPLRSSPPGRSSRYRWASPAPAPIARRRRCAAARARRAPLARVSAARRPT